MIRDTSVEEIEAEQLKILRELYPKLDVDTEFRDATAWWVLHYKGYMSASFFADWLRKCQDKYESTHFRTPGRKIKECPEGFWDWLDWKYPRRSRDLSWENMLCIHRSIVSEYDRYLRTHGPFKKHHSDPATRELLL